MKAEQQRLLLIAGLGVAGIYAARQVAKVATKATEVIATPIANVITAVTLPGEITLRGIVELPNGTRFPLNDIRVASDLSFSYKGTMYRMRGRDGNVYYADLLK